MSYTIHENHRELLQNCPKCGKEALAQPRENLYRCLWCGFQSDVSDEAVRFPFLFLLTIFVVIAIVVLQS
ncbi:MAG: hypothetical protein F6J95_032585 [Leptolyngbya sp. SIO1E4]|nr:hypothetical protein [Leptolyngbya sp. SIO1E4]